MPSGVYKRKKRTKSVPRFTRMLEESLKLAQPVSEKDFTMNQTQNLMDLEPDMVNHPPHYTFGKYEVIDVLQDWFPMNPLLWQTVKYVARASFKGNYLEDLKKAEFYLKREIERTEKA